MNKIIRDYAHDYRDIALNEHDLYLVINGCLIEYLKNKLLEHESITDSSDYNYKESIISNFIEEEISKLINKPNVNTTLIKSKESK